MITDKHGKRLSEEALAPRTYLDGKKLNRPLSQPILQGTIFTASSASDHAEIYRQRLPTFYQRFGHPTSDAAAEKVAALEGAEAALAFSSGMAAVTTTLLAVLRDGGHIVVGNQVFEQTEAFLRQLSHAFNVAIDFVDTTEPENVAMTIRSDTVAVYVESPTNPLLLVSDIAHISTICSDAGVLLIVDSTFATPFGQKSLELGASLVLHSGTKLLSGHMDVMCGFVAGDSDNIREIKAFQRLLGGVLDPHAAWLALRGIKTLGIRTQQIFATALKVAHFLGEHRAVKYVYYPLHETHPQFALAQRQMRGGGCVVVFSVAGGRAHARRFMDSLELVQIASSLGGVETVIELPYDLDWSDKIAAGETLGDTPVDLGHVRLSLGIEPADEIIADLRRALSLAESDTGSSKA